MMSRHLDYCLDECKAKHLYNKSMMSRHLDYCQDVCTAKHIISYRDDI